MKPFKTNAILDLLIAPFCRYYTLLITISILFFLPIVSWEYYNVPKDFLLFRLINVFALCVILSYCTILVGILVECISTVFGKIILYLELLAVWIVSFGETFMIKFFQTKYDAFIFQMIDETKGQETREFIFAYCNSLKFCIVLSAYMLLVLFGLYGTRIINKLLGNKLIPLITGVLFLIVIITAVIRSSIGNEPLYKVPIGVDSFTNLRNARNAFLEGKAEFVKCDISHENIVVDSCSVSSPKIILIIGESFNKHHSSLYGYGLDTNPLLGKLDGLYVFNDVITSVNATSYSIRNFFSMTSVDEEKSWADSPFFMAYFKKSGYYVTFYSNQYPKGFLEFNGGFLDMPTLNEACFDFRNTETFQFDGDLLDHYEKDRSSIDIGDKYLSIIHLMGQHMLAQARYPEQYAYFTADSINRPDLTEQQKWEVAYYDNATRYNDYVVKRIIDMYKSEDAIVVYFADHGDEVNDFRPHCGRSFDIQAGAPMLHCQMDVPLLVYPTKIYRERHPEMISKIEKALNSPFMTDDLPHFMLGLAGIYTPLYNSSRNLIDSQYNMHRKRLVGYEKKYNYDEYCNK